MADKAGIRPKWRMWKNDAMPPEPAHYRCDSGESTRPWGLLNLSPRPYAGVMQTIFQALAGIAPTIAMIAILALIAGGIYLIRTGQNRTKGVLMLVAAAVFFGNVLLWTLPA